MECSVCCNPFTKVQRRKVGCLYCGYEACATCVQQFLLTAPRDATCMSCGKPWNREFLSAHLPKTWLHTTYKEHRETVLLEREISLLPTSQALVQNYRTAKEIERTIKKIEEEQAAINRRMRELNYEGHHLRARLENIRANHYQDADNDGSATVAERRAFVRACPSEGCRGFLSTAWKCGVCGVYVCPKCHGIKGADRDAEHACNPDDVASAALLAKDSRPCPKCASMIYRVEGCDQMWCTACNTAFSWRTGRIVTTGQIHNPHYYEYMRRTRGGVPRNAGDVPCGGLCGVWELNNKLRVLRGQGQSNKADTWALEEFHQSARHVQNVDLPRLATHFNANDHADLRLRYLLNEIDKDEWKRKLQQREKKRDKELGVRQVYEMYVAAVSEAFRKFLTGAIDLPATLAEARAIRDFANESLERIAQQFNMTAKLVNVRGG